MFLSVTLRHDQGLFRMFSYNSLRKYKRLFNIFYASLGHSYVSRCGVTDSCGRDRYFLSFSMSAVDTWRATLLFIL